MRTISRRLVEGTRNKYYTDDKIVTIGSKYMRMMYESDAYIRASVTSTSANQQPVEWNNLVVIILINHQDTNSDKLIQAHFDTWIKRTSLFDNGGLDIFFITDINDPREFYEILPDADRAKALIHLHRSAVSSDDSNFYRSRVVDALEMAYSKFQDYDHKKYYIKIDLDSYLIAERFIDKLNALEELTHTLPVNFGKGICNTEEACHTTGGLYVMNHEGCKLTLDYIRSNSDIYNEFLPLYGNSARNVLEKEEAFISFAFRQATGYPVVNDDAVSMKEVEPDTISIYPVQSFMDFYVLEKIFYSRNHLREASFTHQLFLPFSNMFKFSCLKWDDNEGEAISCSD